MESFFEYPQEECRRISLSHARSFGNGKQIDDLIAAFAPCCASYAMQHRFYRVTHVKFPISGDHSFSFHHAVQLSNSKVSGSGPSVTVL
jgi:hypothetical protein